MWYRSKIVQTGEIEPHEKVCGKTFSKKNKTCFFLQENAQHDQLLHKGQIISKNTEEF